ncbi:L-threonylcarbamoyladenylate synthase [Mangrovicoccus algicola]|uniref:Threonylcarbamoyl-AMP synthase n=1 Tax=Mangrovicoccus algicola TaxID=2771008 RepID=A0A8J7CW22_9RHOB|nr:L-threonylcarbamoyladenylate synthase [Mangrovicoccus algicola]MBE3639434.1 threonylcarbamoyl-AMP synthase [Mangrovicoccus algicola]
MDPTQRLLPDESGIAAAALHLQAGRCVAFPTETVYGLGANALSDAAVAGIYAAKGRPAFNPLIVHLAQAAQAARYAEIPAAAERLEAFWPGPLTLVLPLRADAGIAPRVSAGHDSIALRVPAHPLARRLLAACGLPLAAPSANPSGRISPTTAGHVMDGLGGRIAAVLDGGPCKVGVESTILDLTGAPRLLRAGGVPAEALEEALSQPLLRADRETHAAPIAPGMLSSHYAPKAGVRLNATEARDGEVLLGFGPVRSDWTLSASGDLEEAAANLFTLLHRMDAAGIAAIAVAPIPDHGLGRAINDRLARAAAPRD